MPQSDDTILALCHSFVPLFRIIASCYRLVIALSYDGMTLVSSFIKLYICYFYACKINNIDCTILRIFRLQMFTKRRDNWAYSSWLHGRDFGSSLSLYRPTHTTYASVYLFFTTDVYTEICYTEISIPSLTAVMLLYKMNLKIGLRDRA